LFGAYKVDDEGVPAERVSLVEKGVLKSLYMSRTPRKEIKRSNGHGRGLPQAGAVRARAGNMFVTAGKAGLADEALRAKAVKLAKAAGVPLYVVRVGEGRGGDDLTDGGRGGLRPLAVVSLRGGKEEPVRGITLEGLLPKALTDIVAVGREPFVYNTGAASGDEVATSVVTPGLLFSDVEVRKDTAKHPKPPLYPHPHFDKP